MPVAMRNSGNACVGNDGNFADQLRNAKCRSGQHNLWHTTGYGANFPDHDDVTWTNLSLVNRIDDLLAIGEADRRDRRIAAH